MEEDRAGDRAGVFRPSVQPTMSLEELAERRYRGNGQRKITRRGRTGQRRWRKSRKRAEDDEALVDRARSPRWSAKTIGDIIKGHGVTKKI